jgi:hypothetical protein
MLSKVSDGAVLAAIISALVSMVVLAGQRKQNKKLIKANVIVQQRIEWMGKVRELTAEYITEISKINSILYFLLNAVDAENKDEYKKIMNEFIQVRNNSNDLYLRLCLYFNNEEEHSNLINLMKDFQIELIKFIEHEKKSEGLNPSYIYEFAPNTDGLQMIMINEIRKYLKDEWERVKEEVN